MGLLQPGAGFDFDDGEPEAAVRREVRDEGKAGPGILNIMLGPANLLDKNGFAQRRYVSNRRSNLLDICDRIYVHHDALLCWLGVPMERLCDRCAHVRFHAVRLR